MRKVLLLLATSFVLLGGFTVVLTARYVSKQSPADADGFRILERAIRSIVPSAIVAPYLVAVATDARHYTDRSENVFRFLPLRLAGSDLDRMHGIDERIGIREYETAVRMYRQIVVDATGKGED